MGLSPAVDKAQAIIEEVLCEFVIEIDAHLDNIGLLTNGTFTQHLVLLFHIAGKQQDKKEPGVICRRYNCRKPTEITTDNGAT
eukprot:11873951-Ditylum_brightwellii.AAC.1